MKAALRAQYGPPEVVRVEDVATPVPERDEVLVHVRAASINRADLDYLAPRPRFIRLIVGLRAPRDPRMGIDVAGVVEAVGPAATRFKPGDAVFADLFPFGQGAFAEFVRAPERAFQSIGPGMTFEDAATLPHSAILAIQGLRDRRGRTVQPGQHVLIDGASGNVGPFAVQIAKALGAEVTAVASRAKLDFVRSLGPDHVLDYTAVDYTKGTERYDWILDPESHHPIWAVRKALKPGGRYASLGGDGLPILSNLIVGSLLSRFTDRRSGLMTWWRPFDPADVEELKRLHASGVIKPPIDRTFPLADIAAALRYVYDGRNRGKVVITV